jgi:two-component system, response regulator PdtaR
MMSASPRSDSAAHAILIVDDEKLARVLAADIVSDLGVVVHQAGDAEEALFLLAAHSNIAVLFTDISMPGAIDGMGLALRVNQLRPDIGIIVTSGKAPLSHVKMPLGGTFLAKPYRPDQLMDVVEKKLAANS